MIVYENQPNIFLECTLKIFKGAIPASDLQERQKKFELVDSIKVEYNKKNNKTRLNWYYFYQ